MEIVSFLIDAILVYILIFFLIKKIKELKQIKDTNQEDFNIYLKMIKENSKLQSSKIFFRLFLLLLIFAIFFPSDALSVHLNFFIIILTLLLHKKIYTNLLKKEIINNILKNYHKHLQYNLSDGIPLDETLIALNKNHNENYKYTSSDLIETFHDVNNIRISNARLQLKIDKNPFKCITLFNGIIAVAPIRKNMKYNIKISTISIPKKQNYRVHNDNQKFEEVFDIYSNDKIMTMRLLTPDITSKILDLQNKIENNISISLQIKRNTFYFVCYHKRLFQTSIFSDKITAANIASCLLILNYIQEIVDLLINEVKEIKI